MYKILNMDANIYMNSKWNRDLNINIDMDSWKLAFKIFFNQFNDNMLVWFQYCILTRCIGVKNY